MIDIASEVTDIGADESVDTSRETSEIATSGEDGFFDCPNISDDVATADSEDLGSLANLIYTTRTGIRNIELLHGNIYQGVKNECNQDTAIVPMGEDFMVDICSNSLGILPMGYPYSYLSLDRLYYLQLSGCS